MITRIEIGTRREHRDPRGEQTAETVRRFLGIEVAGVRTRDVYRIEADLASEEPARILQELCDPVLHDGALGRLEAGRPRRGPRGPVASASRIAAKYPAIPRT